MSTSQQSVLQSSNQGSTSPQPVLQLYDQVSTSPQPMLQSSDRGSNNQQMILPTVTSSWIPESKIKQIKEKSCSRKNFAKNLACILFDEDTRINSNVAGRGKRKLNPIIVNYIR